METTKQTNGKPKKDKLSTYIKYSGVGMQMVGSILIGVFGGLYLDKYFQNNFKWFTVSLTVLSIVSVLYSVSKEFMSKK
ncbi:MAG: hypothetical protein A3H98_02160 [Bacteroidetes bacterium RIFCSPLOWO2_02_FULL_36_8]|nr:MAG: hypothetical protein A3H98_02160 [Bacteroidetes bacterium RIFCSPLOWO2_02_FULL_36_8]